MPTEPERIKAVFLAAVEKYAPNQWPAYLDEACAGDADLRRRVEVLLTAHANADSLLDQCDSRQVATIDQSEIFEAPGTVIGPYKLLEQIGDGGFGVVFMAEQTQPVRRKVALKVLKAGMDTRQVVARFEAERQALAIMDHPNIARVFDGGSTDDAGPRTQRGGVSGPSSAPSPLTPLEDSLRAQLGSSYGVRGSGRPYFVMELVKGVPITDYCDQNHLTPRQRLELFVTVCQAVQHAHQKGIIHRDLKPSNVLVAMHDTTPVVKVIDFGVAKAMSQELTEKTLFTAFAEMIGTPLYMSPEQAGQSSLDIDTRSDIYSLGVLLYELLTGTTPFDKQRFKQAAYDEIRHIIREEEPPKPSTRLSGTEELPSVAAKRGVEPKKLSGLVRGELDWIVMKALEKDRNRRYETASGFAMDLQRYLADEPILAGRPSANYRLRKFLRRNRGPVLAASAVLLALICGIAGTTWQAVVAIRQRDRAVQAERSASAETQLKELARRQEAEQRRLADERRRQASLATMTVFMGLATVKDRDNSPFGRDEPELRRLLELGRIQLGKDHPATLGLMTVLADTLQNQGTLAEAESLLRSVLDTTRRVDGEDNLDTAFLLETLANVLKEQGKLAESESLHRQAIETRRRLRSAGETHGSSTNDN